MMKRSKLGVAITAFFITFLAVGCSNTSSNNSSNSGSDKYTTYMNQGKMLLLVNNMKQLKKSLKMHMM